MTNQQEDYKDRMLASSRVCAVSMYKVTLRSFACLRDCALAYTPCYDGYYQNLLAFQVSTHSPRRLKNKSKVVAVHLQQSPRVVGAHKKPFSRVLTLHRFTICFGISGIPGGHDETKTS